MEYIFNTLTHPHSINKKYKKLINLVKNNNNIIINITKHTINIINKDGSVIKL